MDNYTRLVLQHLQAAIRNSITRAEAFASFEVLRHSRNPYALRRALIAILRLRQTNPDIARLLPTRDILHLLRRFKFQ